MTKESQRRFVSKFFATAPKGTKDEVLTIAADAVCTMAKHAPRVYVVTRGGIVIGSGNKPSLAWADALRKLLPQESE